MAKSKIHREDGLLSAQMLNGIPEVDLGINTKLSNIERTEAAKRIMGMCSISLFYFALIVNIYGFSFPGHLWAGIRSAIRSGRFHK